MSRTRRDSADERQPLLNGSTAASLATGAIVPVAETSNVVGWDSPEDPENPRNWGIKTKSSIITILTAVTVLSPLSGVMFAPAIRSVLASFGSTSETVAAFLITIFVTGYAAGPLLWAPLSEIYGRRVVTNFTNIFFLFSNLASAAAPSLPALIIARFFGGFFSSACFVLGGGIINDVILPEYQGKVMAVYSFGALLSPVFGPMTGGFVSAHFGWRWIFWGLSIFQTVVTLATLLFLHETNAPILLDRKTKRLREQGRTDIASPMETGHTAQQIFTKYLLRPFKMLVSNPIVALMSILVSVMYSFIYLLYASIPFVFGKQYGWDQQKAGLSYLGMAIGSLAGLSVVYFGSDRISQSLTKKHGVKSPEYRLALYCWSQFLMPIGLMIYGWSAQEKAHWIIPISGTFIFGFGTAIIFSTMQNYLIEAFTIYAASALAAGVFLRSMVATFLPLVGPTLNEKVGYGWSNTILSAIALVSSPLVFFIYAYGDKIRKRYAEEVPVVL